MSRIVIVTPFAPPAGGLARHSTQVVEAFENIGYECLVIAPRSSKAPREEKIFAHSRVIRDLGIFNSSGAWRDVREFKPELIFTQYAVSELSITNYSVWSLLHRAKESGIATVTGFHETVREYNRLGPLTRFVYRHIARVTSIPVAFSKVGVDALRQSAIFPAGTDIAQVPLGTSGAIVNSDGDLARVRLSYALDKPTVMAIGFIHVDKGIDVLLDAAKSINDQCGGRVRILIAGSPGKRKGVFRIMGRIDKKFHSELKTRAATELAGVDVMFRDFVSDEDFAPLMHAATIVVLPYKKSSQSAVANAALASGAAVVASDIQGLRGELGDAARYFAVGDSQGLADLVAELLEPASAGELERMRAAARQQAADSRFERTATEIAQLVARP